jgi:hypothetical protein
MMSNIKELVNLVAAASDRSDKVTTGMVTLGDASARIWYCEGPLMNEYVLELETWRIPDANECQMVVEHVRATIPMVDVVTFHTPSTNS